MKLISKKDLYYAKIREHKAAKPNLKESVSKRECECLDIAHRDYEISHAIEREREIRARLKDFEKKLYDYYF